MHSSPIHFQCEQTTLTLHRYPPEQKTRSLQAWDAADELLIQFIHTNKPQGPVLILNDQFGALACALHSYAPISVSDSYIAQLATRHNLAENGLAAIELRRSVDELPDARHIILKVPNNHGFLRHQLRQLKAWLPEGTQVVAAAKAKDIHANLLQIFRDEIGPVEASLTIKKCRLITATCQGAVNKHPSGHFPVEWSLDLAALASPLRIVNHANVFSRDQLDIGARFLLEHLPQLQGDERVIDLGCGNGVLGVAMLQQANKAHIVFCDESFMALASAHDTVLRNMPTLIDHCEFVADDCLTQQADLSADWIVCNPPFHQQHAVTDHIAWQMLSDARRVLKIGGRMRIVFNRHLDYADKLSRLFGGCIHIASNAKFVVLETIRRK